jgi:hypothetical protein
MINIIVAPGCYGTYIARCLHHYTSPTETHQFDFDKFGSSHVFRKISRGPTTTTKLIHWEDLKLDKINKETTIIVTGDVRHRLDYFINQYYKQSQGNLLECIAEVFKNDIVQQDLEKWNYQKPVDETTPAWILREYFSFYLAATLENGYDNKKYLSVPHIYSFCCENMWDSSMWDIVNILTNILSKKIHASKADVEQNHLNFLNYQKYHNMQIRCDQFVRDTIDQVDSVSPCVSLFDEAYVQHQLREYGYEIRCNNLDIFPKSSIEMHKYIFKV